MHSSLDAGADGLKDPLIGLKLGEYELRSRVGVGGMGLVYEGIQPLIGKRVAVKVLRPELAHSSEQVERLLAEARAVNAIRHRGIIDIFGFGQVPDGRQYIVMEFLEGQALDAMLAEKVRLPVAEALSILDEVLAALGAAHGAGVVHRDLKPSNIFMVRQPDGTRYVKVLDFGLAKRGQGPTGRTAQTRTDMVVGTPEYMAPEQARGQEVGAMTDLYALGVVTFEMVTGRLPFVGSSPVDLLMKHVEARPPRPSEFVPDLPPALDAFVLQMLTKDPEARPNSADALRQQLTKLRRSLRATRSNPSALAPSHEPPALRDDADSRRPTTPVAPIELSAAQAAAVSRASDEAPRRKRPIVAATVGAAAVLLAVGAAVVLREPAQAVSLTPSRPAPEPRRDVQPTPTAETAPRTTAMAAPGAEGAGAHRTADMAAPGAEGAGAHRTADMAAPGAEGAGAHRTADMAAPGAEGTGTPRTTAMVAPAAEAAPRTTAMAVPASEDARAPRTTAMAAPAAEGAGTPRTTAMAGPAAEGAGTPRTTAMAVPATGHAGAPTVETAPAAETASKLGGAQAAPAEPTSGTEPARVAHAGAVKPAGSDATTRARLLKRIDSLEDKVPELVERGQVKSPDAMLRMLTKYRQEAELASDAEERRDINKKLNSLESMFIKPAGR
ncbi:protein kinase [Myxococcus stipitatus]|nr:protein kinase [Myxococcus stipitatus]